MEKRGFRDENKVYVTESDCLFLFLIQSYNDGDILLDIPKKIKGSIMFSHDLTLHHFVTVLPRKIFEPLSSLDLSRLLAMNEVRMYGSGMSGKLSLIVYLSRGLSLYSQHATTICAQSYHREPDQPPEP